ncbi:MAG: peroxiredoxin [Herpetosiphon sp.]
MEYSTLQVGDPAPDFILVNTNLQPVQLANFHGRKNVVLLFYSSAFSSVCSVQLPQYEADAMIFNTVNTELLAISTDSPFAAREFARQLGLHFQLLSDQQRAASAAYGVLREEGFDNRGVFVIDKQGILRHIEVVEPDEQPAKQAVLETLVSLETSQAGSTI